MIAKNCAGGVVQLSISKTELAFLYAFIVFFLIYFILPAIANLFLEDML